MSAGPGGQRIMPTPPNGPMIQATRTPVQSQQILSNGQILRTSTGGMIVGAQQRPSMNSLPPANMQQQFIRPGMSMVSLCSLY